MGMRVAHEVRRRRVPVRVGRRWLQKVLFPAGRPALPGGQAVDATHRFQAEWGQPPQPRNPGVEHRKERPEQGAPPRESQPSYSREQTDTPPVKAPVQEPKKDPERDRYHSGTGEPRGQVQSKNSYALAWRPYRQGAHRVIACTLHKAHHVQRVVRLGSTHSVLPEPQSSFLILMSL
jgi:hypothetical protein